VKRHERVQYSDKRRLCRTSWLMIEGVFAAVGERVRRTRARQTRAEQRGEVVVSLNERYYALKAADNTGSVRQRDKLINTAGLSVGVIDMPVIRDGRNPRFNLWMEKTSTILHFPI